MLKRSLTPWAAAAVTAGLVGGLAFVAITGCKTRSFEQPGGGSSVKIKASVRLDPFDVNDVSILFPKEFIKDPRTNLSNFMTGQDFNDTKRPGENATGFPHTISFSGQSSNINAWKVVSFRYDPCAPGSHVVETIVSAVPEQQRQAVRDQFCTVQVRLIAQPFNDPGTFDREQDVTFHLLYNLTDKSTASVDRQLNMLDDIRKKSAAAGAATDGVPLGIHPGLKTNQDGVKDSVAAFLSEFAKPDNLNNVAVMALANGGPEPWIFYAVGRPTQGGTGSLSQLRIPTVDDMNSPGTPGFFQALSFIDNERVLGKPTSRVPFIPLPDGRQQAIPNATAIQPRSTDAIFLDNSFNDTNILPMGNGSTNLDTIHLIDNPKPNLFFSMDCVSCHTTSNLMMRRLAFLNGQGPEADFIRSGRHTSRFPIPQGVTGYAARDVLADGQSFGRPWSVRNFGYFSGKAVVAMRTVTESAEVAHEINHEMMGEGNGPHLGPNSCKNLSKVEYDQVEPELYTCMHFGSESPAQCLQRLCSASGGNNGSGNTGGGTDPGNICSARPPVAHFQDGNSFFVIQSGLNGVNGNLRSRAIVIPNPDTSSGFDFKLDFVHENAGPNSVRTTLDVELQGNNIRLRHRNTGNLATALGITLTENDEFTLQWNGCNRWEGESREAQFAIAQSEDTFNIQGRGASAQADLRANSTGGATNDLRRNLAGQGRVRPDNPDAGN